MSASLPAVLGFSVFQVDRCGLIRAGLRGIEFCPSLFLSD